VPQGHAPPQHVYNQQHQQQQPQAPPLSQQQHGGHKHAASSSTPTPASSSAIPLQPVPKKKKVGPMGGSVEDVVLTTRTPDEETADGRIRNKEAIHKIRDAWIYKQVRNRQREFTQYRSVSRSIFGCSELWLGILDHAVKPVFFAAYFFYSDSDNLLIVFPQAHCFVGTWNVNAKGKEEPLDEWLCTHQWRRGTQGQPPDVIAVGFQEIVDLNAVNVAVDNKTQQRSQFWVERLRVTLAGAGVEYTLLQQKSMVGLLICVFVLSKHQPHVRYVVAASVGVGVLGMGGNKGGVSIRLQFYDSTLCFVCSHLAAHRENVAGRNADFANILNKTSFDIGENAIREVIRSGSMPHWTIGSTSVRIADHDIVFWLGDLNYRIDESMTTEKVLQLSEKADLEELRTIDQLNVERAAGRVFEAFEEGPLNFVPTYKYQPGTDVFEQRPDKKLRARKCGSRILAACYICSIC